MARECREDLSTLRIYQRFRSNVKLDQRSFRQPNPRQLKFPPQAALLDQPLHAFELLSCSRLLTSQHSAFRSVVATTRKNLSIGLCHFDLYLSESSVVFRIRGVVADHIL